MLESLRVVDLSADVAGAFATRFFAAFGADVIKVEPPGGDVTRAMPPSAGSQSDQGILFAFLNAGKRGIVVDPDALAERGQLLRLLKTADLVVESGAPGEWAARGIDLTALLAQRPRLVLCSISPFGQDGPRAGWRATALTAFAAGGQMSLCGDPDRSPLKTAGHQAHYQAGLHGFAAAMTALLAARRTGIGEWIDISIQEAQAASLEAAGPNAMVNGFDAERSGNQMRAVWGIYPCRDGHVGVASMARQVASVYRCIGHPELVDDPAFNTTPLPPESNDLAAALISEWTSSRTAAEIYEASQRHRAPFSLIPSPADLLAWPALRDAGFWAEVEHPALGRHTLPGMPFSIDGSRGELRRAPLLGEHSARVFAGLLEEFVPPASAEGDARAEPPPALLHGLLVLDLTQVWAGPYATRFFADVGADVIHIEGPSFPDAVRVSARRDDPRGFNKSPYFNEYNRNKRGLTLDLRRAEGLAAFRRLVRQADVVIENWSAGVAEHLGLGYAELCALNPRLVMVQMPGFGQVGPEAERVGFGPTIEQMGGLVALQGYEGGPPHKSGISYGDPTAGIVAAGAAALALLRREHTGAGAHVVVVQRDNIIGLIGESVVAASLGVLVAPRNGNQDLLHAPHAVYRARDDAGRMQADAYGRPLRELHETWLAVDVDSEAAWQALRGVVEDVRLDDPAYATAAGRRAAAPLIDAVLSQWARGHEAGPAAKRLQGVGVSAMPALSPLMLQRDGHLQARGFYVACRHPEAGEYLTTRPVWRLGRRPFDGVRPAPCFGEHNAEVLRELGGYSAVEIEALQEAGVLAERPRGR